MSAQYSATTSVPAGSSTSTSHPHTPSQPALPTPRRAPMQTSPAVALPAEVLGNIFLHRKAMSTPRNARRGKHTYDWRWIQVSHVCQRWREIALDFAPLWVAIPPVPPRWINVLANRARRLPLRIELDSEIADLKACYPPLVDVLKSHTSRVESLALRGKAASIEHVLCAMDPTEPTLHTISIIVDRVSPRIVDHCPPAPVPEAFLPDDFLADGAPNLRILRLHDCSVHIASKLPLNGITHFDLGYGNRELPLSPKNLVAVLQDMESLTHLRLQWQPSSARKWKESQKLVATLPKLENILLEDCWGFLNVLRIPYTTMINLEAAEGGDVVFDSIGTISSCWILPEGDRPHPPPGIYEFKGDRQRNNSLSVRGWRHGDYDVRQKDPVLKLSIRRLRECVTNMPHLARTIITALEVDRAHTIHLDCFPALLQAPITQSAETKFLPHLLNLSVSTHFDEVSLRSCLQDGVNQRTETAYRYKDDDRLFMRIPQLRNITFNRVDFERAEHLAKMADLQLWDWNDLLDRRSLYNRARSVHCMTFIACTGITREARAMFRKTAWAVHFLDDSDALAIGLYVPITK